MKRILTIIAAITMLVANMAAQNKALATLSHEGQLTFFDNVTALESAIAAAVDGDIIYLSDGKFGTSNQSITIQNRKISIVGNGYNSHILPNITFKLDANVDNKVLEMPLFDGVRLETVGFDTSTTSSKIQNLEIKKCLISNFNVSTYVTNITLDRCKILTFGGYSSSRVNLYNCKIGKFTGTRIEVVENCNINTINSCSPSYIVNSIIKGFSDTASYGVYENCLIGNKAGTSTTTIDFRNCYDLSNSQTTNILDDNLECTIEDMSEYVGTDGTVVGIYGGQWFPYSETPSVPTVDSANSSVEYDKENNQLKVTITVAPN